MGFSQTFRLCFIQAALDIERKVNRRDLIDYCGVSEQQASKDLTLYSRLWPDAMRYDLTVKSYLRASGHGPMNVDTWFTEILIVADCVQNTNRKLAAMKHRDAGST